MTEDLRTEFFRVLDRGGTVRAAAAEVGVLPGTAYGWVRRAGLASLRKKPRRYSPSEKERFFALLAERGNVSSVANELGIVRATCYKWAHEAGIFTGKSVDATRTEFLLLRESGFSRSAAADTLGVDKRSAQDWDKGIRQFAGGRVYCDGSVVKYNEAERIAHVKQPRKTYLAVDLQEHERFERKISARYLSLEEREQIRDLVRSGSSIRSIAKQLKRSPSTVSRELSRNSTATLGYMPYTAHRLAVSRRPRRKPCKLHQPGRLQDYVCSGLKKRWSPEQISNRLSKEYPNHSSMRVCFETVYQAIYRSPELFSREPAPRTRYGRRRRHQRRHPNKRTKRFVAPMTLISDRPAEIERRLEAGHWEGDLILGNFHRSAIATLVDRASRFVILVHIPNDHNAETVRDALVSAFLRLPRSLRKTLTWDQGAELACHAEISKTTGLTIYFCDPASPWQRGTNENTNGLLREYFPKSTDLSIHSPTDLATVADELNDRPRKNLNWDTPSERLQKLLRSKPKRPVATTT